MTVCVTYLHWSIHLTIMHTCYLFSNQLWWLTRSEGIRLTPAAPTLPYSSSSFSCCSTLGLLSHTPPHHPWGENSVEWMAPDRGLRGRNVSLALEGSNPPEQWRTAQSLLINHCQGCPGPGPNNC